jgi:hypothetical protein
MKISPSQTAPASQGEARQAADAMATGAAFAHASADAHGNSCGMGCPNSEIVKSYGDIVFK